MAMNMLAGGGLEVFQDGVRTADDDNPKGYFELERVKDLEKDPDKTWIRQARGKAVKVISFLLKDLPPDNNYLVVFMRRHLSEVLASQAKMLANRGESNDITDEQMTDLYQNHLWRTTYLLKHNPQFAALDVDYKAALTNPRETAERLNAFLGGRLDVVKMVSAVDESLYRNRA